MVSVQSFARFGALLLLFLLGALPTWAAAPITGTITNRTTGKPAAGDDVVLIRLAQGMQESTRTTTDARGHYSLEVPDEGIHLVRATHDKANYFKPAPPGTNVVDLDVYNAAAHVKGVASEADVLRIQTDESGNSLRVVENFFIKNDSAPPLTQFSNQPFDFWLPEGAVVEGSAALAPGGMPVQAAPVPLTEKGHYTFLFPIRPGETRFQITYRLPYTGSVALTPRLSMTTDTIAIMLPKSMKFEAGATAPYSPVNDEVNAQTFVARNVSPQQPLGFKLSGKGELPRDTQVGDNGTQTAGASTGAEAQGSAAPSATADTRPGMGLNNPLDEGGDRDPWAKYKWWILSGLALLLAAAAGLLLRKPSLQPAFAGVPSGPASSSYERLGATAAMTPFPVQGAGGSLLQVLKEELFTLETERLQHRISEPEYMEQKAALETVLRRALSRIPSQVTSQS